MTGYRRDIDGLRSIAILPVLLYHAGIAGVSGGYVGVDVFFVISGFLITGIISREIDAGSFSIVRFYERRARRILPALVTMLVAVFCAGLFFYFPADLTQLAKSAVMTLAFLSNLFFFQTTGYFASAADTMPLLHTWSLAVEEQFYIGFPILLILIARFAPTMRTMIVATIALFSLALAIWFQNDRTGFGFYMLPPRAWELFVGSLLAIGAVPAVTNSKAREAISLGGLAAILFAVFTYTKDTAFPGLSAIPPVLGAAALIHCAPGTLVGRLLSSALAVGIGLISYSLYLWHWPVIVFTEYALDAPVKGWVSLFVIAASIALAIVSWKFVEAPFRDGKKFNQRRIFRLSGISALALLIPAAGIIATNGVPQRFSPVAIALDNARNDVSPSRAECMGKPIDAELAKCDLGAAVPPDTFVWGDSHSVELAMAISERLKAKGRALSVRSAGSCPPILGYTSKDNPQCADINAGDLKRIESNPNYKNIILIGFWASESYSHPETAEKLNATIARVQAMGRKVVLIGAVPPFTSDVPTHLARLAQAGISGAEGLKRGEFDERTRWISKNYRAWQRQGVTIFDPAQFMCDARNCQLSKGGKPLYFDGHHLSMTGARHLAAHLPLD